MEEQYEREKMGGCGGSCLAAILVVCLFIVGILWFFQASVNTDNTDIPSLLSRKASMQDIYIDCHLDSLAAVALTVKPEHDIENLEITIYFYDKNRQPLTSITKHFGDVKENGRYEEYLYITDFPISQIFKIEYIESAVTGGTVSYFR